MSRSGCFRDLGLNTPVRSFVDLAAVADLARISCDLGALRVAEVMACGEQRGRGNACPGKMSTTVYGKMRSVGKHGRSCERPEGLTTVQLVAFFSHVVRQYDRFKAEPRGKPDTLPGLTMTEG